MDIGSKEPASNVEVRIGLNISVMVNVVTLAWKISMMDLFFETLDLSKTSKTEYLPT